MVYTMRGAPNDNRRYMYRLLHAETGKFLHLDGRSETAGDLWAWSGTRAQIDALRARDGNPEDWPWQAVKVERPDKKFYTD